MKINIVMITYNHEEFIEKAIKGVLMQKCNFDLELILSNDCSSDKTDEVIKSLLKFTPKNIKIKYLKHEKNIGAIPNFVRSLEACNGKYIALCDGDDYWIDSNKLQKQVDFLEKNKKINLCGHSVKCNIYNKFLSTKLIYDKSMFLSLKEVVLSNPIHTSSFLIRNSSSFKEFIKQNFLIGDYPILVYCAQKEGIFIFNETMSVYRVDNSNSIWSGKENSKSMEEIFNKTLIKLKNSDGIYNETKRYLNLKLKGSLKERLIKKTIVIKDKLKKIIS